MEMEQYLKEVVEVYEGFGALVSEAKGVDKSKPLEPQYEKIRVRQKELTDRLYELNEMFSRGEVK
ncbi:MAG: hypothetical protein AABN34_01760 [Acidobacteriota bacterium]